VFEPLLLEECAAQMLRGQEEGQVLSAQPAVVAAAKARAEDESLLVRLTLPPDAAGGMHENDMVLVSRDNPEARSWFDDLCSEGGCCFLLGLEGGRRFHRTPKRPQSFCWTAWKITPTCRVLVRQPGVLLTAPRRGLVAG
jgi:hypothetical protein